MMDEIRVVLVEPSAPAREALVRLVEPGGPVRVVATCAGFDAAPKAAVEHAPDAVLVGLDSDHAAGLAAIAAVAAADRGVPILGASSKRDAETILAAMRAGAREYLPLPATAADLASALARLVPPGLPRRVATPAAPCGGRVIAMVGAAGGIGCTTLAVNLAACLAKWTDGATALVDFDLLLGVVDTWLDLPAERSVVDLAAEVARLDPTLVRRSLARHPCGLAVLPGPSAMEDAARADPEALRKVLDLLAEAYRAVVVDTSKGFHASDFVALERADAILMVVQLEVACLRNSARLLTLLRQGDGLADKIRVVANRVGSGPAEISTKKAAETLGIPIAFEVPNATASILSARLKGVALESDAPSARASQAIAHLAAAVAPAGCVPAQKAPRGRFAAMFF